MKIMRNKADYTIETLVLQDGQLSIQREISL